MKPKARATIASMDEQAEQAGLPTYTELVNLILMANALMPHSSPSRKDWVTSIIKAMNSIHSK